MDATKQALSSGMAHGINLFLAILLGHFAKAKDDCLWYFVNITIDTTVGVFLCFLLLKGIEKIALSAGLDVSS